MGGFLLRFSETDFALCPRHDYLSRRCQVRFCLLITMLSCVRCLPRLFAVIPRWSKLLVLQIKRSNGHAAVTSTQ